MLLGQAYCNEISVLRQSEHFLEGNCSTILLIAWQLSTAKKMWTEDTTGFEGHIEHRRFS